MIMVAGGTGRLGTALIGRLTGRGEQRAGADPGSATSRPS